MERLGQLAHGVLTNREALEHPAPRGVAEGAEDPVQIRCMLNHVVEYIRLRRIVNHLAEYRSNMGSDSNLPNGA